MAEFALLPSEIDVIAAQREQVEAEAALGSASDEALAQALANLETRGDADPGGLAGGLSQPDTTAPFSQLALRPAR